jgi:hypothetical protein
MEPQAGFDLISLLPLAVITIPLAIGNFFLSKRLGRSAAVWLVLSIIPGVNIVFMYYVIYTVVFEILDRLEVLREPPRIKAAQSSG